MKIEINDEQGLCDCRSRRAYFSRVLIGQVEGRWVVL